MDASRPEARPRPRVEPSRLRVVERRRVIADDSLSNERERRVDPPDALRLVPIDVLAHGVERALRRDGAYELVRRFVYADERRDSSHRPREVGERVFVSNDDDAFAARRGVGPPSKVFEPRPERDAPVDPLVEEGVPSLVVAAVFARLRGEVRVEGPRGVAAVADDVHVRGAAAARHQGPREVGVETSTAESRVVRADGRGETALVVGVPVRIDLEERGHLGHVREGGGALQVGHDLRQDGLHPRRAGFGI